MKTIKHALADLLDFLGLKKWAAKLRGQPEGVAGGPGEE
jgi:hypothetical protein